MSTVEAFAEKNLAHVGEARLSKLSVTELRELWKLVVSKVNSPLEDKPDELEAEDLIKGILKMKKKGFKADELPDMSALAIGSFGVDVPPRPETPSPPPASPREDDAPDAVVDMHVLSIVSWNAKDLVVADVERKDEGDGEKAAPSRKEVFWLSLLRRLATYDVIVLQEVPGSELKTPKRTKQMGEWLARFDSTRKWHCLLSEPSGKDGKKSGAGVDVHAVFYHDAIKVRGAKTLTAIGNVVLDYAPFQVHFHDDRFADKADRDFVITSLHLPPSDRRAARDAQLKLLLSSYGAETSQYRMGQSFAPNGLTPTAPTHIICGDFNVFPGAMTTPTDDNDPEEVYGLTRNNFVSKLPKEAATSEGRSHYDNFLIDSVSNHKFLVTESILPLNREEVRLSDHDPIVLRLMEMRTVTKKSSRSSSTRSVATARAPSLAP